MSKHFSTPRRKVQAKAPTPTRRVARGARESGSLSTKRIPPLNAASYGLIQERVASDLYSLLIAAMLWNRTKGTSARPIFEEMMSRYPRPENLAEAQIPDLVDLLSSIGLQNQRAHRFVTFARTWVADPPRKGRRYRKLHYPSHGDGSDVGKDEVLDGNDPRSGWEISHLPGMGPYALDSFRIFHRDVLLGLSKDWKGRGSSNGFEPEWKRVIPTDKELIPYIKWMWLKEGWIWNSITGSKVAASADRLSYEQQRTRSASPAA